MKGVNKTAELLRKNERLQEIPQPRMITKVKDAAICILAIGASVGSALLSLPWYVSVGLFGFGMHKLDGDFTRAFFGWVADTVRSIFDAKEGRNGSSN